MDTVIFDILSNKYDAELTYPKILTLLDEVKSIKELKKSKYWIDWYLVDLTTLNKETSKLRIKLLSLDDVDYLCFLTYAYGLSVEEYNILPNKIIPYNKLMYMAMYYTISKSRK